MAVPSKESRYRIHQYAGQTDVLEALLLLEKKNFSKGDSWADVLFKEVKRRNTVLLYARVGEKIVAYILFTCNRLNVHISKIAVDKAHRRKGVARQCVEACLTLAVRERRVCSASLHVHPTNEPAVKLYQSFGFEVDAVLEDYYAPGKPSWRMQKDLHQPNDL